MSAVSAGVPATASGGALSRHRVWWGIALTVLAALVLFVLLGGTGRTSAPLDPDNPDRQGAQAVRRVLERQGVDVTVVRSAAAFEDTRVDPETTVLVTSVQLLGESTARRLLDHSAGADLVLAEPRNGTEAALGLPQGLPQPLPEAVPADCDEALVDGLEVDVLVATAYPTPQGCFPVDGGFLLARPDRGIAVLGASTILANDGVTDADHAALALRLLGQHPRLVWYVPDPSDLAAGDGVGLAAAAPAWVEPSLWLLAVTVVGVMLWRGRRLGPLVSEPLPVVVSAAETTRSRGRLYRRAGDRAHAARTLRAAACARLSVTLGLPRGSDPRALAHHLAARVGRPAPDLVDLLDPASPPPTTDRDLIELARRLDALDREVRRP